MNNLFVGIFLFSVFACGLALNVTQCQSVEKPLSDLNDRVVIGNCKKPPCRLRKNTKINLQLKIKPETQINKLVNSVHANIVGVPFPFPGVDQTDACSNIYDAEGKEKVKCPLKAGQEYIYKNVIDVLSIYPRLKVIVHWALTDQNGKENFCFEVPAKITN